MKKEKQKFFKTPLILGLQQQASKLKEELIYHFSHSGAWDMCCLQSPPTRPTLLTKTWQELLLVMRRCFMKILITFSSEIFIVFDYMFEFFYLKLLRIFYVIWPWWTFYLASSQFSEATTFPDICLPYSKQQQNICNNSEKKG